MPKAHFGRKDEPATTFEESPDLIVVRTRSRRSITRSAAPVPSPATAQVSDGKLVVSYPEAGVEVFRVPVGPGKRSVTERKIALRAEPDVRFAGGVLVDPDSKEPVLYTENLFIKFTDSTDPDDCLAVLREAGLTVKEQVRYATNAYFVEAQEGTGQEVFEIAERLLKRADVEYCHPETIRPRVRKGIFAQQWHLKKTTVAGVVVNAHANVDAAHLVTKGAGVTIAIIDDGIDIDHPEFTGANKIVAPRDATENSDDPRPKDDDPRYPDNHGTACAGVACAAGARGASGVAPEARLMPIRLSSGLGSQNEANAFVWAADHGADVISCSWGPPDGDWWDVTDPVHNKKVPLPANTKLAMDYVFANGRGGKGCVVLFAAGNGRERVENDGYASYGPIIAVAACNDRGLQSVYSDFGAAIWCAFPSSDSGYAQFNHPAPLTAGIWTTDRVGSDGYNSGQISNGDADGLFTNDFGGTSSACPGAAGVAALVLSVNPALKHNEVKALFKSACDRIDSSGGNYDANGHSLKYGYGRLNALTAVTLAKPQPQAGTTVSRRFDSDIPDLQTVSFSLSVPDNTPVQSLSVEVDLKHTYIGDLILTLIPPAGAGQRIVLHNRAGGSRNDLKKTYDAAAVGALAAFAGRNCQGTWTLEIRDAAAQDTGTLVSFGLVLAFAHAAQQPAPAPKIAPARRAAAARPAPRQGRARARA